MTTRTRRKRLKNKRLLVGITGSVAAYKSVELIRRLKDIGASVIPVMTDASCRFITPLSVELAAGEKPLLGMFDNPLGHISAPADADLMLIAPATANTIGKLAQGLADDLLSAAYMAFRGPVVVAPAMNTRMYESPAFVRNLEYLHSIGVIEVPPSEGVLACGVEGKGRMAEVDTVIEYVRDALSPKGLAGQKVVISAGPTREYIDPVRYISNRSSGRMGYELARAARALGASVVLISGPSSLAAPSGVSLINVETAAEMHGAVMAEIPGAHLLVMAAAVADFRPARTAADKLAKGDIASIELTGNDDILKSVCGSPDRPAKVVGFAAQTGRSTVRAAGKLNEKGADYIVFNDISSPGSGFDVETNKVTIIGPDNEHPLPLMSKYEVAEAVLGHVLEL